jgi:hypothetical protein
LGDVVVIQKEIFYLIFFVCGGGMVFSSLYVGFLMGRRSLGLDDSKPKAFNPGPNDPVETDPYRDASPGQEDGERIPTVDKP